MYVLLDVSFYLCRLIKPVATAKARPDAVASQTRKDLSQVADASRY